MTGTTEWQGDVGRVWAEMYRQTDRSFAGLTQHLLDCIAAFPGELVLDVGCGAGELALAVARARPMARAIGIDVSQSLIHAANMRREHLENAEFETADAAIWRRPGFAPDLLISRHGVMFFPEPVAAFAHLRSQAAASARLLFSCFRTPRENRWMSDLAQMLPVKPTAPPADPHAPGPFAFADPQRIEVLLAAAGWQDIDIAPFDFAYVAGLGEAAAEQAQGFFARIGPAAARLRALEGEDRDRLKARIGEWIADHQTGSLVAFPAAAWIVTARA